jgi:hypothetical protein
MISCERREAYTGTYEIDVGTSEGHAGSYIELKQDGEGLWVLDEGDITFRWHVVSGELRITTKSGGIIKAAIQDNTITLRLPRSRTVSYTRKAGW